ncbi:MAG: hypothetical protein KKF54_03065, partial [Candidatus Omnitrophica bacterium]|nr:hypothetical protein [Candidatus Omnitrophota bacterium]
FFDYLLDRNNILIIYFAASYFPCNSHQLWYIIKQEGASVLFYFFIDKGLGGNPSFTHPLRDCDFYNCKER